MRAADRSSDPRATEGAEERYEELARAFLGRSGVTREGVGFG